MFVPFATYFIYMIFLSFWQAYSYFTEKETQGGQVGDSVELLNGTVREKTKQNALLAY